MRSAGKSVNSITFSNTVLPLPSSQARVAVWSRSDGQLPDLEFLGGDLLLAALREGDLVEQPIGAALIGDVFGAVGEQDVAHQPVAVPVLAAGELAELMVGQPGGELDGRRFEWS